MNRDAPTPRLTLGTSMPQHLADVPTVLSRQKARFFPTVIVFVAGLTNIVYGLLPRPTIVHRLDRTGLLGPLLASRLLAVMVGIGFLLVARMLWRGSRLAWTTGVVFAVIDLLVAFFSPRVTWTAAFVLLALIALLVTRSAFRLEIPIRPRWRLVLPLALAIALLLFALVSYRELGAVANGPLRERLMEVIQVMAFGQPPRGHRAVFAYVVVGQFGFLAVMLATAWALFTSYRSGTRLPGMMSSREVQLFVERWGRSSAAPLLMLEDNSLLTLCGGDALAGIGVSNNVAVCLGAPTAPPELEEAALREFVTHCERVGWTPALIAADERQRALAQKVGFSWLRIGVEAFLDVGSFTQKGSRRANVRHTVTRARKEGLVVKRWTPELRTDRRVQQLRDISDTWLQTKGGPELGFTLGRFDPEVMNLTEAYIAMIGEGTDDERVVGFVTWLPYDGGRSAVLDLMRRAEPCPPGTIEVLIVDAIEDFKQRGRERCSLGGVPLASVEERRGRIQEMLGWIYEHGGSVYEARGLFRYKDKFDPMWEPMYLCYPVRGDLPSIAVAVLRSYLPKGAVGEAVRVFNDNRKRDAEKKAEVKEQRKATKQRRGSDGSDGSDGREPVEIPPGVENDGTRIDSTETASTETAGTEIAGTETAGAEGASAETPAVGTTSDPAVSTSRTSEPAPGAAGDGEGDGQQERRGPRPESELTAKQLKRRRKKAERQLLAGSPTTTAEPDRDPAGDTSSDDAT